MTSNIKNYCNILPPLNWSPNIEELLKDERMPRLSVVLFQKNLVKHSKYIVSAKNMRLIESYASDFIHRVRIGEVLTPKHFLLGLGLHSITGQKKPVQIDNRLGHSMNYHKVMEIETANIPKFHKLLDFAEYLSCPSN